MDESYRLLCLAVFGSVLLGFAISDDSRCGFVLEESRLECGYLGVTRTECDAQGCCWDDSAVTIGKRCYKKGCAPGWFGWGCRFQCLCEGGAACDPVTGQCSSGCRDNRWGVGCLLDSSCTYNDRKGEFYSGKLSTTKKGFTCGSWSLQTRYPGHHFPEKDLFAAENFCRNPKPIDSQTWCYHTFTPKHKWDYCQLEPCECEFGRFGVNCAYECHCSNANEACHPLNGTCSSGCDYRWTGANCQECAPLRYGPQCLQECHCYNEQEACDKKTGRCVSGCARGWTGLDCQTECADGRFGLDCMFECNCHDESEACNKQTGACRSGCRTDYSGTNCQIRCRCQDPSEICSPETGRCLSGCLHGWTGTACDLEIPRLLSSPEVVSRDLLSITLEWPTWARGRDRGHGPVVAYYVYHKTANTSEAWHKQRVTAEAGKAKQRLVITELRPNEAYVFKVAPIHENADGDYPGLPISASTCGKPVMGPQNLRIIPRKQGRTTMAGSDDEANEEESHYHSASHVRLDVQWEVPPRSAWGCTGVKSYRLYRKTPGSSRFTFWKQSDNQRVLIPNVNVFSNYSVGVSITNSANQESDMTVATFIGRPSGVQNLEVRQHTPVSLYITWDAPRHPNSEVRHYVMRYKELRISDCDVEQSTWSDNLVVNASHPRVNLTNLHPFAKYQYRVRAITKIGRGKPATAIATTKPQVPRVAVQNVLRLALNPTRAHYVWDAIECENRFGKTLGYQYELRETEDDVIVRQERIKNTEERLEDLTPYTQYSFRVRFANQLASGPYSEPDLFRTLSSRPPAPRNLQIFMKTSSMLSFSWEPPQPTHGILTSYEVQYWTRQNLQRPLLARVSARHLEYNMTGLQANTSFGIQVRAYTEVGHGPWSDVLYGFTDEGAPDSPHNFLNVSRSVSSLSFTWEPPKRPSGILREFKIECTPVTFTGRRLKPARIGVVPASVTLFVVSDLEPGTKYECALAASTSKGFGDRATGIFWTLPKKPPNPEPPIIAADKSTDKSIVVILKPTESVPQPSTVAKSTNQIVVERRTPAGEGGWRRRRDAERPCNLSYPHLVDHDTAARLGFTCYVAASLNVTVEQVFVIGDNRTYGGYHNAPLETGLRYQVWYGVVIDVDGVTAASYSKSETPAVAAFVAPPAPTEATMIMAGVGVAAMVAVVCLIILVALLIARRRRTARNETELIIDNNGHLAGPPPRPPRKCDEAGKKGVGLPDVCTGSTDDLALAEHAEMEPLYGNTIIQEPLHVPISVENLWNYVKEKKSSKTDSIRHEYEELPMGLKAKCEIARRPENKIKNRYGNIVAYDHSRVVLACLPDDPHSDYINADYIDGYRKPNAFIATQGPSKHTLEDIWRLAWQENSRRIVMVTNLVEDGRQKDRTPLQKPVCNQAQTDETTETGGWPGELQRPYPSDPGFYDTSTLEHKCEHYWPDGDPRLYGDIWVEMVKQEQLADFTVRTFHMTKDGDTKTLRQFHFTAWPDHGVPAYATSLLAFRKKVRSFDDPSSGPTIVHCSAGVGRTGTFIALDFLLDQAKVEGQVDVFNCVQAMRSKRVNMIQTQEQYVFVYDALLESLKCGDTSIPCVDFRRRYADMNSKVSQETGKVRLEEEFELLGIMSPPLDSTTCRDALDPENIQKNRYTHIVPLDDLSRAYLTTYTPGGTDYINAVFVDGYRQRDAFIVTQMPLPHTIMDFWLMVFDHGCNTIIMMNELDPKDDTCACYWPEEGAPHEYGPLTVELRTTDNARSDIIIRDFVITVKRKGSKEGESHTVRQFQYLGWPRDLPVPANKSSVITLITLIEKWQQRSGNHVITVHCMDGATQSGVFCATSYVLERLKVEQEVDVFQSTKHIRINRPHLVPNMDQYRFLYDMAIEYMDCFDAYANFK